MKGGAVREIKNGYLKGYQVEKKEKKEAKKIEQKDQEERGKEENGLGKR